MQAQVETEDGFLPIPAVLSQEIDNLAVLYADSSDKTWNALAFQINQVNRRIQHADGLPTLDPGGSLDFGYIGENGHSQDVSSPGKDVFRIGTDRNEVLAEYGFAVKPAGVLVGVANPADETITGVLDADRLRGYAPEASNSNDFNNFGAAFSQLTYTNQQVPTTALSETPRQGVIRFDRDEDERNNIYFGFKNTREDDAPLEVLGWGATYKVSVVESGQVARDIVFGNGYKRRVLTYGGLSNTNPKRPSNWVDHEITLTTGDVNNRLSRGGGR